MKLRITKATFTVVSFAGLVLLGLLIFGLNAGKANAQRVSAPSRGQVSPQFTANAQPVATPLPEVRSEVQYYPNQPLPLPTTNNRSSTFDRQPFNPSSAISMQPIVVAIKNGPQLRGEPVELSSLQVKTIFGPASIPLDRIAGVRMADDPRQPTTLCLSNGDTLTGVLVTDTITIKTEWGSATVARDHIVSIATTTEPMTWQQHEGRWRIVPSAPAPNTDAADNVEVKVGDVGAPPPLPQSNPPTPAVPIAPVLPYATPPSSN